VTRYRQPKICT